MACVNGETVPLAQHKLGGDSFQLIEYGNDGGLFNTALFRDLRKLLFESAMFVRFSPLLDPWEPEVGSTGPTNVLAIT